VIRRFLAASRQPPWRLVLLVALLAVLGWWASLRPSNDRDWTPNMAVLPWAELSDSVVRVHGIRHTAYQSTERYVPRYYDKAFDLRRLERAWFVVVPFGGWGGVAHTFLTFEFGGPEFVAISVEARRERGEQYHFLKGLFRRYELAYIVADERDAIGMRANVLKDQVFLYPVRAPPERVREVFVAMLERANELHRRPRFYNTLVANCTSTIVRHVNALVPDRIPWGPRVLFPGYSDRLAYDLGLIASDLPFERVRERFRVTEQAARYADSADFSVRIRQATN
jgi:hypothetical protein